MPLSDQLTLETAQAFRELDALQGRLDRISDVRLNVNLDTSGLNADIDRTRTLADQTATAFGNVNEQVVLTTEQYRQVVAAMEQGETATRAIAVATGRVADEAITVEEAMRRVAGTMNLSETEARDLASAVGRSTREATELDEDLKRVARSMGLSEQEASQFARQMSVASGEAATLEARTDSLNTGFSRLKGLIVGAVAAFGVRGLVRQFDQAIDSTLALSESVNAVNVIFEEGADQVLNFAETAADAAGLAVSQAQQLVVPIGASLRNFGFDAESAGDAAVVLTQRAADLASVFNTEVPEALTAIQAALRGETDPIERFGASISAARVEAFALSEGLAATKGEITDAIKVQARYGLILEDTAKVQDDFANTSDQAANRQRILAAEVENARAAFGEELLPAFEEILDVLPDLIENLAGVGPLIGGVASAVVTLLTPLVDIVGGLGQATGALHDLAVEAEAIANSDFAEGFLEGIETGAVGVVNPLESVADLIGKVSGVISGVDPSTLARALDDIRQGAEDNRDPIFLLREGFARLNDEVKLTEDVLADLIDATGIADEDLTSFLVGIISNADNLDLTTEEVRALKDALIEASAAVDGAFTRRTPGRIEDTGDAAEDAADQMEALASEMEPLVFNMDQLRDVADTTGFSLSFIAQNADIFGSSVSNLVDKVGAAEISNRDLAESFAGLADAIVFDTSGAVEQFELLIQKTNEAGDTVPTTVDEMLADLREQAAAFAELEAGTLILEALGFEALAADIRSQGPDAIEALRGFLGDIDKAREAEDIFDEGGAVSDEYIDGIVAALDQGDITPELLELVGGFTSNEVRQTVLAQAVELGSLFGDELQRVLNALDISLPADVIRANLPDIAPRTPAPGAPTPEFGEGPGGGLNLQQINNFNGPAVTGTDIARITQNTASVIRNAQ